jgi:hypothetical protein
MQSEWLQLVASEGTVGAIAVTPVRGDSDEDDENGGDELPCPACGTAAPLVDGACSDCGLQLG